MKIANDFIYVKENALDEDIVDQLVVMDPEFEDKLFTRQEEDPYCSPLIKEDRSFFLSNEGFFKDIAHSIVGAVKLAFDEYVAMYPGLTMFSNFICPAVKYQVTDIGQGYHTWHCEVGDGYENRVVAWSIGLNEVDGGELEFLYQHRRINFKPGMLVMWPANFTHMHRGNPPLKGTKKIITGWINWKEKNETF